MNLADFKEAAIDNTLRLRRQSLLEEGLAEFLHNRNAPRMPIPMNRWPYVVEDSRNRSRARAARILQWVEANFDMIYVYYQKDCWDAFRASYALRFRRDQRMDADEITDMIDWLKMHFDYAVRVEQ